MCGHEPDPKCAEGATLRVHGERSETVNIVFVLLFVAAAIAGAVKGDVKAVGQGAFDGAAQGVTLAIGELDKLNPTPGTATNAQVLFLATNTASLQLVPTTVIALRASAHSNDPAGIILPCLGATVCALTVAIVSAKGLERVWK